MAKLKQSKIKKQLTTAKEITKTPVAKKLKNQQAVNDLAAFAADGEEVKQETEMFIRQFPIETETLLGYYLGHQRMTHKDGSPVLDINKKEWITHKFMTTEGELVFINRAGMLDKRLDNDTELGQKVYRILCKGKFPMNDGSGRSAYIYDIASVKAAKPLTAEEMSLTDSSVVE